MKVGSRPKVILSGWLNQGRIETNQDLLKGVQSRLGSRLRMAQSRLGSRLRMAQSRLGSMQRVILLR